MKYDTSKIVDVFARYKFKVVGVFKFVIPKGSKGKEMTAPYPGFIIPLKGKVEYTFGKDRYISDFNKLIHGNANVELSNKVLSECDWEYILIFYEIDDLTSTMGRMLNMNFEINIEDRERLVELAELMLSNYNKSDPLSSYKCDTFFRLLLEECFIYKNTQAQSYDKQVIERIIEFIHLQPSQNFDSHTLCAKFKINTNRLYYLFNKYLKTSPTKYILEFRLTRAKNLLKNTNMSVTEIANIVGYNDSMYFSRAFKKRFGLPPSKIKNSEKVHK